jgi:hypothetical protein
MSRSFFSAAALPSLIAQLVLFFIAAAVLALLYLSYRPGDYLTAFVFAGMLLIVPWLVISLLPTILVLKDRALRRELLWNQIITMLSAFAVLCGLSVYAGADTMLLYHLNSYLDSVMNGVSDIFTSTLSLIKRAISVLAEFYQRTIVPLFSG